MKSARAYRQGARAEAAAETRERILDAAMTLFLAHDYEDVTLDKIAGAAGVTLQTVLRKFGSKEGLAGATIEERAGRIMEERRPAATGARAAVAALVASYEDMGDANWRMLRQESQQPVIHEVLVNARAMHRAWIEASFARELPAKGAERERMIDALFTVLDFYVWKLHRRDLGRSREETEALMLGLVEAVEKSRRTR